MANATTAENPVGGTSPNRRKDSPPDAEPRGSARTASAPDTGPNDPEARLARAAGILGRAAVRIARQRKLADAQNGSPRDDRGPSPVAPQCNQTEMEEER